MRLFIDNYLQVRYITLNSDKISSNFKMMVIGDVHISDMLSNKKIELIKKRILEEKVDYVFFVGDLIDKVEELNNKNSLYKLHNLLEFSVSKAKTFIVLGNHDYIHRKSHESYLNNFLKVIKNIKGVIILNNNIYYDNKIYLMGYTETREYYCEKKYDYDAFYNDFLKHDMLYKNVNKNLFTVALIHSPEFSNNEKCLSLLKDYDLIICGHTHDGCIPFGIGNFKRGIISPKKTFFPKNVRGLRKIGNNYILITGGIVKIQKCAPKLLHPLNHLCPMQLDCITISDKNNFNLTKKWY